MKIPQVTGLEFLANVEKSGLLPAADLEPWRARAAKAGKKAHHLASTLVRLGKLTRFQARALLAGQTDGLVVGQYVLLKQRGKGGLGKVYKAVHRTLDRVVAVKILASQVIKTEKARELFQREAVAVGQLKHPNIVTAYDAHISPDECYLVMEYIAGPDLDRLVRKHGPLSPPLACEMIRQAALGLQYAYAQGMLHRDIKPANLLLQRCGAGSPWPWTVKLVDFGLARLHDPDHQSVDGMGTLMVRENTVMGTPDYLSPEQSRDLHRVDIRSDLYSLGCTFYFVLSGQVPFPGGTALEKMIRQVSLEPRRLEELRADVPTPVADIVRRLMAKRPEDRFQTPGELAEALVPLAASRNVPGMNLAPAPPPPELLEPANDGVAPGRREGRSEQGTPRKDAKADSAPLRASRQADAAGQRPDESGEATATHGILLALGMVAFIVLLAVILSAFAGH